MYLFIMYDDEFDNHDVDQVSYTGVSVDRSNLKRQMLLVKNTHKPLLFQIYWSDTSDVDLHLMTHVWRYFLPKNQMTVLL